MTSDPAHDPNTFPVEALEKPHVLSTYNPAFRAIQKQREHERLVSNLPRLKRNAPRPENSLSFCIFKFVNAVAQSASVIQITGLTRFFQLSETRIR
jgi:hypothetical protein